MTDTTIKPCYKGGQCPNPRHWVADPRNLSYGPDLGPAGTSEPCEPADSPVTFASAWDAVTTGVKVGFARVAEERGVDVATVVTATVIRSAVLWRAAHHARRGDTAKTVLWVGLLRGLRPVGTGKDA